MRVKVNAGILMSMVIIGTVFAAGMQGENPVNTTEQTTNIAYDTVLKTFHFSPPTITEKGRYAGVAIAECSAQLLTEGAPELPYDTYSLVFPLGTTIHKVTVIPGLIQQLEDSLVLQPSAVAPSPSMDSTEQTVEMGEVYTDNQMFPSEWLHWQTGVGLQDSNHVLFFTVQVFPTRYLPAMGKLQYVEEISIEVQYSPGTATISTIDEYDFLIITPEAFRENLQPLVNHKEGYDIATQVVTLEEIYGSTYFASEGRDEAERVKYFIKNAVENWGITYVMLVGGRNGGVSEEKWWCPVRYVHLNVDDDRKFLSDLYFADLYRYDNGTPVFESWDENDNSRFGEWRFGAKDDLDMFPDIYIGRLACRNAYEVNIMVDKIITYETSAYGQDWANRYVGIGGDTFVGDQWYDGEESVTKVMEYLEPLGMEFTTLFTSDGTLTEGQDIIDAVSAGCGFLNFEGHGNPMSWANHPPQDADTWIGIDETQFMLFKNSGMYPVCIIGGCSNSKFNITLLNLLKFDHIESIISHSDYGPESFGWWIVRAVDKGAIASIACTSYGYGKSGDSDGDGIFDGIQYRGGFIDIEFFRVYAQEEKDILGDIHGTAITNFLLKFPPMTNQIDGKSVEEWVLLGDPTLKVGGYAS